MGEQTEEEKKKKEEQKAFKRKLTNTYLAGAIAIVISLVIVFVLWAANVGSQITVPASAVSGVSIFAVFYLLAQFDERIVEAFSNWKVFGYQPDKSSSQNDGGKGAAAKPAAKKLGDPPNADPNKQNQDAAKQEAAKQKQMRDDSLKHARIVSVWCLASAIGIILCYVTAGLMQFVGITFTFSTISGHLWDAIISGIIVGGGTKPLHDVINLFDNSSNPKSTTKSS